MPPQIVQQWFVLLVELGERHRVKPVELPRPIDSPTRPTDGAMPTRPTLVFLRGAAALACELGDEVCGVQAPPLGLLIQLAPSSRGINATSAMSLAGQHPGAVRVGLLPLPRTTSPTVTALRLAASSLRADRER